jgi:hypothetical protein
MTDHYYEVNGVVYQMSNPFDGATKLTKTLGARRYRKQSIEWLQEHLVDGQTVYAFIRKVSASGMQREISLYTIHNGELLNLDHHASTALHWKRKDGIVVRGCGMDMAFHLVDTLGYATERKLHERRL